MKTTNLKQLACILALVLLACAAHAQLVPPSFVTEPVSQKVYTGQTVTFTTTVNSPGNVQFAWYSNNVVIFDGQADNGNSSSYTLYNVSTNFSASYKVAVSNDVVFNGIVSSNAVLTVVNPPAVSIAYLRTLVDPVTFNATNVPPSIPYQITGTVTTYTNLVSYYDYHYVGSSFYLQDGTGGINVFTISQSFDNFAFVPAQGDVVIVIGVLSNSTSGLELYGEDIDTDYPYTSWIDTGNTNALPKPIAIPFNVTDVDGYAYVNTNLAGSLVQLTDVHFGTNAGMTLPTATLPTGTNQIITVTNSSGQKFNLTFFPLDLDTAGQTLPTYAYSVTGVLYGGNTNFSVGVTRFADIVTNLLVLTPTNSPHITQFTLAGAYVMITGTNGQAGGTYYLLESTNVATPLSQWKSVATNVVNTNGASGAFTFTGTNVVTPGDPQEFYILSNTNSNP